MSLRYHLISASAFAAIFPFSPVASAQQICKTTLDCANIAASAATEAAAAATAVRRQSATVAIFFAGQGRSFAQIVQNDSDRTMIVIVSADRHGEGCSMYGNLASEPQQLPSNGGNGHTAVAASFNNGGHSSNITLIVPSKYYYNVTVDCATDAHVVTWSETKL